MPSSLGAPEILVILVVALIVLGPKRLPEAGRQIGKAMSEVRRWSQSVQSEIRDVIDVDPDLSPRPTPDRPTPTTTIPTTATPSPPDEAAPARTGVDAAPTPTTAAEPPSDGPPAGASSPS